MFSTVSRSPRHLQSLDKVGYLYLDRAIGSSLIPNWGFVSGSSDAITVENSMFFTSSIFRLLISCAVFTLLVTLYLRFRKSLKSKDNYFIQTIFLLGLIYSILIGTFYNPEPRYMMFSAFITVWLTVYLFDVITPKRRFIYHSLHIALLTVLICGLNASSHRSMGPEWKAGLTEAREKCKESSPNQIIEIRTLPLSPRTTYVTTCNSLK